MSSDNDLILKFIKYVLNKIIENIPVFLILLGFNSVGIKDEKVHK